VAVETARHLALHLPVRPGAKALEVAQDRLKEKEFIAALGIGVAPFRAIDTAAQLSSALGAFDGPAILKSRKLGYDGKGQAPIAPGDDADAAWRKVGAVPAVLEKRVAFALELSVLVVRGASGELAFYDSPCNTHEGGILRRSVVPSGVLQDDLSRACDMAGAIARALDYVGVLAVEMFYLGPESPAAERLMVNEIAPRVHNSGHWTIDGASVSQFEQHIRAVAGLPLGKPIRRGRVEMTNLLGDDVKELGRWLATPGAAVHLYGKTAVRAGRKMGHVTQVFPE
jgi:5-(carboxyamino)imidazole ribonucleotide synthase